MWLYDPPASFATLHSRPPSLRKRGGPHRPPLWIPAFAGMTGLVGEEGAYGAAVVDAGYCFAD